jgi:hypothetical protein
MRRCLLNVQAMISHAEIDCRDTIIHALNGRKLKYAFIFLVNQILGANLPKKII